MLSNNTYDADKLARLRNLARFSMCEVVAIYLPDGVRSPCEQLCPAGRHREA